MSGAFPQIPGAENRWRSRGGQDRTSPHRRRGEGSRRLEDRGLVRLQQPRTSECRDRGQDPRDRRRAGLPAASRGSHADSEEHHDDRPAHPAGPLRRLRQSLLRHVVRGSGSRHRPGRLRAALRLAAPRVAYAGPRPCHRRRFRGRRPVGRPPRGRADPARRRSDGPRRRRRIPGAWLGRIERRGRRPRGRSPPCRARPSRIRRHRHRTAEHAGPLRILPGPDRDGGDAASDRLPPGPGTGRYPTRRRPHRCRAGDLRWRRGRFPARVGTSCVQRPSSP